MRMRWITLNEETNADGFLLDGQASFAAELRVLAAAGCPDVQSARFVSFEVLGREESAVTADVSEEMACWLEDELDAERLDI